ncbi:MAG TPA: ATP-binding protein [Candidatus Sulfopaludibacter sp.]|jgi:signal transduction histidine kinase|nr:ATP-binding protein [Candidatus Sulfopaludibacter sp.]
MSFRTRLLLLFALAVVASVGTVEWLISGITRESFERTETQRVDALVAQFQKEFTRRKEDIVRAVNAIAGSDAVANIASSSDYNEFVNDAEPLAASHSLDLLELVAADGAIISSAEWRARFGYKEDWLVSGEWKQHEAFLKREEVPDGVVLSLVSVAIARVGDQRIYVVGGQILDSSFLSTLVLPAGMRVLLYRNLDAKFSPSQLIDSHGSVPNGDPLRPLIQQVIREKSDAVQTIGGGAEAETFHASALPGYGNNLLGVLLIGSSRRALVDLEASLRSTGIFVALGGMLLGVALSWWAATRVTLPVQRLAESAGKVAAGNWDTTVDDAAGDEIGQLARAFNGMTHQLVDQRQRLLQAERVAAWRELARRLAHELKNPLFPLQITVENMQRARERYPEQFDEVFREGTSTLLAELANLKQIIGRFSDFAKMPAPEMQPLDFNAIVAETLKLFDAQLVRAQVTAHAQLDPRLRPVPADEDQMTRVLRNLVLNAIDAMPQGGTLTVRTTQLPAGGVRLEVSDTGQGLTPEECDRLFTPYYTTKTHGTGLGLAIVQSVISDHHGRISVLSQPGSGATFRIELGA